MILYTSDSHLSHRNIIAYAKRPYRDVGEMDRDIVAKLREAEQTGARLVHAGDLCMNLAWFLAQHGSIFAAPVNKHFVAGNHDRLKTDEKLAAYQSQFETVTGDERTWKSHSAELTDRLDGREVKVLVSHKPQENLWGADVNVYGHVHNNPLFPGEGHHPEDDWATRSPVHFCACVELHDFRPVTLQAMADAARAGYPAALPAVERHRELHPNGFPVSYGSRTPVGQ